jgi:hypothetical protein
MFGFKNELTWSITKTHMNDKKMRNNQKQMKILTWNNKVATNNNKGVEKAS